jgi:hypothetical protein
MPGVNDTLRSDLDILKELAFFFRRIHMSGASLGGIIYVQPITANRVQGSSKRSLRMLEQLCGLDALPRLVLCSTMWNKISLDSPQHCDAVRREEELVIEEEFWGYMLRSGSHLMRFDGSTTTARMSVDILCNAFEEHGSVTLQVQRELSGENACLLTTSAARVISTPLDHEIQDLEIKLARLENEKKDQAKMKRKQAAEAVREREQLERKFQEMSNLNALLQQRMDDFYAVREAEFNRQQELVHKLRSEMEKDLKDHDRKIQVLQEDEADNEEVYREYERTETRRQDLQAFENNLRLKNKPGVRTAQNETDTKTNTAERMVASYKLEQQLVRQKRAVLIQQRHRTKMKVLFLNNALPVLQMLGGVACIAAGATIPPAAPIIGPGIGLLFSGSNQLRKNMKERRETKVQDDIDNFDISDLEKVIQGGECLSSFPE